MQLGTQLELHKQRMSDYQHQIKELQDSLNSKSQEHASLTKDFNAKDKECLRAVMQRDELARDQAELKSQLQEC